MEGRLFLFSFALEARRRPEGLCRGMLRSYELGMGVAMQAHKSEAW